MSSCEKCWRDSAGARLYGSFDDDPYGALLREREASGNRCTPEEQAGQDAKICPTCKRKTLHQWTTECMAGCRNSASGHANE